MKTITLTALFATLAVAAPQAMDGEHDHHAPVQSNDPDKTNDVEFTRLDTDKDGFISKSELPDKHPLLPHFGMVDKNRDDKLDRNEFEVASKMLASMHH